MGPKILLLRIPGTFDSVATENNGAIHFVPRYPGFLYVTHLVGGRNLRSREPLAHRISLPEIPDVIGDASLRSAILSEGADMTWVGFIVSAVSALPKSLRKVDVLVGLI